jgi:hypothetical protein
MRKIYNHLLNGMRQDHTNWLIHFVRDRLPEQDFPGETEEEYLHHVGAELEPDADAFCVLKTIIRLGGLYPGYSFRSGRTTIYGGEPVVCATEMPLYSFAKYVSDTAMKVPLFLRKLVLGIPAQASGKNYAAANASGGPSRPASFAGYPARGIQHHSRNDSTRYRKACIFTTQKALRENTCTIASAD